MCQGRLVPGVKWVSSALPRCITCSPGQPLQQCSWVPMAMGISLGGKKLGKFSCCRSAKAMSLEERVAHKVVPTCGSRQHLREIPYGAGHCLIPRGGPLHGRVPSPTTPRRGAPCAQHRHSGYGSHRNTGLGKTLNHEPFKKAYNHCKTRRRCCEIPPAAKLPSYKRKGSRAPRLSVLHRLKDSLGPGQIAPPVAKEAASCPGPCGSPSCCDAKSSPGPTGAASTSGAHSAAHHELPAKALPLWPDVLTAPCACIQNLVLHIPPSLPWPRDAQLCHALPCHAVPDMVCLFQVPLLAHNCVKQLRFDSVNQALASQLKRRWRTEPRSNLSHNSPAARAPLYSDGGKLLPEATSCSYNHFSSEISAG